MVDQIFSYGELGIPGSETSKYVTGILEKNGFTLERGVAGIPTAWVATYGSGKRSSDSSPTSIAFTRFAEAWRRLSRSHDRRRSRTREGTTPAWRKRHGGPGVERTDAGTQDRRHAEIFPGVAEELLARKRFWSAPACSRMSIVVLGVHVSDGVRHWLMVKLSPAGSGPSSISFHGKASHAAGAPWDGRSALVPSF